ncbi:MAG: ABC transporter permease [Halodesulfurarchaeum sp.]
MSSKPVPHDIRDELSEPTSSMSLRLKVTTSCIVALVAGFATTVFAPELSSSLIGDWVIGPLEWLWLLSWVVFLYIGWPVLFRPARTRRFLRRFRRNRLATVAGLFLLSMGLLGTVGPLVLSPPAPSFTYGDLPPVGFGVDAQVADGCKNLVGDTCYGTLAHPLGTTEGGEDILRILVYGTRLIVELAMIATAILVPLATVLGTTAAVFGTWTDRAVTGIIDIQRSIPALFVFLLIRFLTGDASPFHLVAVFGIANAGSVASVVRSRALDEVGKPYIRAARSAGASRSRLLRDHVVPNVAHVALTAAVLQVPTLIVLEATLSHLQIGGVPIMLHRPTLVSWGKLIGRYTGTLSAVWWPVLFPVLGLVTTVFSLNVAGEGVRQALGPEGR